MAKVVSNTSPLLYLHQINALDFLPQLFDEIWTPKAVTLELEEGTRLGYETPNLHLIKWVKIVDPIHVPSEWLTLDLGAGELATMALALEHPQRIILLDDQQARRVAQAAGINVWGTLRVLLESKKQNIIPEIRPFVDQLHQAGLWFTDEIRQRILKLADEI